MSEFAYEISYGKSRVPVYRVFATPLTGIRRIPESSFTGRCNTLFACEVDVEVFGDDFLSAYTEGDNRGVVATDSMKNVIIRQALSYGGATLEGFLFHLADQFATTYEQLRSLRLVGRELPFAPVAIPSNGGFAPSDRLYDEQRGDHSSAMLRVERDASGLRVLNHECGRLGLHLLKITGSAFTSFVRDDYTTLPDRKDRPLFVYLDVRWRYADPTHAFRPDLDRYVPSEQVRDLVATVFHEFVSESIQHLVHEMGSRVLTRFPQLVEVSFEGQNRTRDPFAASDDDDRVRVYSDPFPAYGTITLQMRRTYESVAHEPR